MSRSSCPPSLEKKLNREVHYKCPICSGIPLVRAHTVKSYSEVGWNYDYLLSICIECERKVENKQLDRSLLNDLKNSLKKSFSTPTRGRPHQIRPLSTNTIKLGSNTLVADTIFSYRNVPIIWFEVIDGARTLNARFYDVNGTVITAIDKNMWTADRERFYDIESTTTGGETKINIVGKRDDTKISLILSDSGLTIFDSVFYIPKNKIEVTSNGELIVGSNKFERCGFTGGCAFNFE